MTALVADVGGSSIKLGEVAAGRVLRSARLPNRDGTADLDGALGVLARWQMEPVPGERPASASGWALPGIVVDGVLRSAHDKVASLIGQDVGAQVTAALGLPTVVENDARAAGWGEFVAGAGRGAELLLTVTLGTGVGYSIVVAGRALDGADGHRGVLGGHQRVDPRGRRCTCGGIGCLEAQASGWALPQIVADLRDDHPGSALGAEDAPTWPAVLALAGAGDGLAAAVREEVVRWWAVGTANAAALLGPDRVVLTGGMAAGADYFIDDLRRQVAALAWAGAAVPRIVVARDVWGSALLGMADLAEALARPPRAVVAS